MLLSCFAPAQRGVIKVRKAEADTGIAGQWISAYAKARSGQVKKIAPDELDTLSYLPNNVYIMSSRNFRKTAIYELHPEKRSVTLRNIYYIDISKKATLVDSSLYFDTSYDNIGVLTKDTLAFIYDSARGFYYMKFYYRKK